MENPATGELPLLLLEEGVEAGLVADGARDDPGMVDDMGDG